MPGDYTRFTFDPLKSYSGVLKQQGRVSLDADFNEFEEILDRRNRAGMYDILNEDAAGKAVVPQTTPNAFQIGIDKDGQLTIGAGRAYVDGILVECFGDPKALKTKPTNDTHLGGVYSEAPCPYIEQPFHYKTTYPTLSSTEGDMNLVYLDVWQREVTVWEDDDLREPALNGPDTATRVQTAWQVKVLPVDATTTCDTEPDDWKELTAASTARLSCKIAPNLADTDPCVINPAGGYTGLENRLYRVEVHQGGTLGGSTGSQATFKWSRDNASLAARVVSPIRSTGPGKWIIKVGSTGRDSWMRFQPGDHIELLDDAVEFAMRERGVGGTLAKVVNVDQANAEVHVDVDVDVDLSTFEVVQDRHPRLRRWDYLEGSTEAEPLERATNGGDLPLEKGITITFSGGNEATLHAGDYWVFAARPADGSIKVLVDAPPRGILHHFARLALVKSGSTSTPTELHSDCRIFWPRDFRCCTVVVRPGQSIQAAIDSLPAAGGCVCLKAGIHPIKSTIKINRSNVRLHGESKGAEIHATEVDIAILIAPLEPSEDSLEHITVEDLRIVMWEGSCDPPEHENELWFQWFMVTRNADLVVLQGTQLLMRTEAPPSHPRRLPITVGVHATSCGGVVFRDNTVRNVSIGVVIDDSHGGGAWIYRNYLIGTFRPRAKQIRALCGIMLDTSHASNQDTQVVNSIEQNVIAAFLTGVRVHVDVDAHSGERAVMLVIRNQIIHRRDDDEVGTQSFDPLDSDSLRSYLDGRNYGIDLVNGRCTAQDNRIEMDSPMCGGIRVITPEAVVSGNTLISKLGLGEAGPIFVKPGSIYCTNNSSSGRSGSGSTISNNMLEGPQVGIVVSSVTGVSVLHNRSDGQALDPLNGSLFGVRLDDAHNTKVVGNLAEGAMYGCFLSGNVNNVVRDSRITDTLCGVFALEESDLGVHDNKVTGAAVVGLNLNVADGDALITHNRIVNCGWEDVAPSGIFLTMPIVVSGQNTSSLRIESCEILEPGVSPDGTVATSAVWGIAVSAPNCQILGNRVVSTDSELIALQGDLGEHRALLLHGPWVKSRGDIERVSSALIANNVFRGPGWSHLVEIRMQIEWYSDVMYGFWFDRIAFTSNYCDHYYRRVEIAPINTGPSDVELPSTVLLSGLRVAVSGNHIAGGDPASLCPTSLDCEGCLYSSVVGNVTTGDIVNLGTTKPSPPDMFNMRF